MLSHSSLCSCYLTFILNRCHCRLSSTTVVIVRFLLLTLHVQSSSFTLSVFNLWVFFCCHERKPEERRNSLNLLSSMFSSDFYILIYGFSILSTLYYCPCLSLSLILISKKKIVAEKFEMGFRLFFLLKNNFNWKII